MHLCVKILVLHIGSTSHRRSAPSTIDTALSWSMHDGLRRSSLASSHLSTQCRSSPTCQEGQVQGGQVQEGQVQEVQVQGRGCESHSQGIGEPGRGAGD